MLGYLILTILVLSLAAYLVGRSTARGFVATGDQPVHSLPSYHGAFVAIWVGVPALVLVLLWLMLQGTVIDGLLVRSLPDGLTAGRDAGPDQPPALRDPERRRRPHLHRAEPRGRRGRRTR